MAKRRKYRSFDEVEEEYFLKHPEEIDDYLTVCFEEFAKDNCTPALLSSLRMIARVKGVTATADAAGMSRKGLQKALSEDGNPRFENINAIMQAMGYRLIPEKFDMPAHQ
ncbi:addiction module antidote protein [Nitrospira sp. M1]